MKCPKCYKEIEMISASIACSCGFTFKGNPLWVVSPVSEPILSEITNLLHPCTPKKLPGWGPMRPTYTNKNPAHHAVFNSITDNAVAGDERNFVRIAEKNSGKTYSGDIVIEAGKQYEVYIYYHNNASSTYNDKTHNYVGVARDVRLSSAFSRFLASGEKGVVAGRIEASNTDPKAVWSVAHITAKEDITLQYVSGSARIYNKWEANGRALSMDLFTDKGTFIGLNELNGVILGCDEYSGQIVYTIQTKAVQIEQNKEITYPDGDKYIGDVKRGKRHGIGTLFHRSGETCEGVWVNDVFSDKLTAFHFRANWLSIEDRDLCDAFGLESMLQRERGILIEKLNEELEVQIGHAVGEALSDKQMDEFESLAGEDAAAMWLKKNVPNFQEITRSTSQKFFDEIIRDWLEGSGKYIPVELKYKGN